MRWYSVFGLFAFFAVCLGLLGVAFLGIPAPSEGFGGVVEEEEGGDAIGEEALDVTVELGRDFDF